MNTLRRGDCKLAVFSDISMGDKPLFDKYMAEYNPQSSEFTFTNFFMWRKLYRYRFAVIEGLLCVLAAPENDRPYALAPIGNRGAAAFKKAVEVLKAYFICRGWKPVFKKVPEEGLAHFERAGMHAVEHDRDNSDYVYLAEELINLKGKKFDGKRNHINRFKREHSFEYVTLTDELVGECKRIMKEWCIARDCSCRNSSYCEKDANEEALDNFRELRLKGALIKVDGRFEAFTAGELLNPETAVVHIEKANPGINGLFTLINQQFCEREWSGAKYINREQDLGQEGLRKAKLSYHPVKMVNKYIVYA